MFVEQPLALPGSAKKKILSINGKIDIHMDFFKGFSKIWHLTPETWHMTHDMWQWWGVNILSKFQLSSSHGLGVMIFWRFGGKGSLNEWMTKVFVEQPDYPGSVKKVDNVVITQQLINKLWYATLIGFVFFVMHYISFASYIG